MRWLDAVRHALAISASMTWQILWALIFGFVLWAVVSPRWYVGARSWRRLGDDHRAHCH